MKPYSKKNSKNARNNPAQAYDQAVKQSELPARLTAVTNPQNTTTSALGNNASSTSTLPSTSSAFSNTNTTTSAFGQPAFGQPSFGQSAFGQPSFGQPVQNPSTSTTSTAPTGAFGQPLNNAAPVSAFVQPVQPPATTSVFGQPNPVGQSTSSFIKPASGAFSAFNSAGSTGAFGGGGNNTTPAAGGSAFSAFASQPSAFSLAAQNAPTAGSAFGQPSFGQPVTGASVPTTTSVFGNPAPGPTSVFGAPSAFGILSQQPQPQQPVQQEQQQQTAPVWPSGADNTAFKTGTIAAASQYSSPFGAPTPSIPPPTKSARIKSIYQPGSTPYDQQIPPNYKEALPKTVVQAFEKPKFEWGCVPEWVPPVDVR